MRHLVLLASLALATAACRDAAEPGDLAPAPADVHDRIDLRQERASLIAAGNEVSAAIAAKGVVRGFGAALTGNALLLSPRTATVEGRAAVSAFLAGDPIAPTALRWEVIAADVSNDASQGYTWSQGSYTIDLG
ncbi:MAG: hypothetical protein H0T50_15220, partial [Gemmatimonadales bacterium]|nr:hypothetical protein [Gemmatimonadales bacterium]